jgi:hypothetical protein
VEFCDNIFGCYLHHNPHAANEPDPKKREIQFLHTKELLVEVLRESGLELNGHIESATCDGGAYCDGD